MFIVSKRNYMVRRADGSLYLIKKDYIGDIPQDVAGSGLVRRAIRAGMVFSPQGHSDRDLKKADMEAGEKALENDIRPDVEKKQAGVEVSHGGEKAGGTSAGKQNPKKPR